MTDPSVAAGQAVPAIPGVTAPAEVAATAGAGVEAVPVAVAETPAPVPAAAPAVETPAPAEGTASLADIANINLDNVEAVRFEQLPAGAFTFQVTEAFLEMREDKKSDDPNAEICVAVAKLQVVEAHSIQEMSPGDTLETFKGKVHQETFWLRDASAIGRVKAMLIDSKFQASGGLGALLAAYVGHAFQGRIRTSVDQNDKSKKYANLDLEKQETAQVA